MTPPSIPFVLRQPFTLIAISDVLAHTTKDEIVVKTLLAVPVFRPRYLGSNTGVWRYGTAVLKGKRKEFHLDVNPASDLVFAGHGTVLVDGDVMSSDPAISRMVSHGFSGNACINLAGTVDEIRELITTRNLNPDFRKHDAVLALPPADEARTWYNHDKAEPVFPEVPTTHAVIRRIRAAREARENSIDCEPVNVVPFATKSDAGGHCQAPAVHHEAAPARQAERSAYAMPSFLG